MEEIDIQELAEYLTGTCNSLAAALDRFDSDMEIDEAEDALLDVSTERCPGCDWWMSSSELVDCNGDVVGCDQCRDGPDDNERSSDEKEIGIHG